MKILHFLDVAFAESSIASIYVSVKRIAKISYRV
jgi:hypothetical protein